MRAKGGSSHTTTLPHTHLAAVTGTFEQPSAPHAACTRRFAVLWSRCHVLQTAPDACGANTHFVSSLPPTTTTTYITCLKCPPSPPYLSHPSTCVSVESIPVLIANGTTECILSVTPGCARNGRQQEVSVWLAPRRDAGLTHHSFSQPHSPPTPSSSLTMASLLS